MPRRIVTIHRDKQRAGSAGSYDQYLSASRVNDEGEHEESPRANPDVLPERPGAPSTPQFLMGEAIEHLQGRQKETYLLTMREGKSLSEVGKILDISKSAAQIYQVRAIKFIELYCKDAIAKGRV